MTENTQTKQNMLAIVTGSRVYTELMSFLAKVFVVLTFFFPAYYSDFSKNQYFIGFLWPYAFLLLFMILLFLKNCRRKWQSKKFAIVCLVLLGVYVALSLYVNETYHHWMWEEIHNTVAFAFAGMLIIYPAMFEDLDFDIVKFLIQCITLSVFIGIVCCFMGYERLEICNNEIDFKTLSERYGENRMSWIYYHKSQFGMMMIVCMGFFYRYRDKFRDKFRFVVAELILAAALYLSHSWASVLAAFLIPAGILLDYFVKKKVWKSKKFLMITVPVIAVGLIVFALLFQKMASERNLLTLGTRLPIWKTGIAYIMEHPWGVGKDFGGNLLTMPGVFNTNNCHNVFLNAMFRFSVPVGAVFTLLFFLFLLYCFKQSKSFFAAGYLLAIVAVMTIDYALLSYGVASFFLLVYLTLRKEKEVD